MTDTSSTIGSTTAGLQNNSLLMDEQQQDGYVTEQVEESMIASSMGDVSMIQPPPVIEIDLPPELIKEYTDGFKLYEQKKTIKPSKPTPVVADKDPKAKGAVKKEDPKVKKVADKKGAAAQVEEPPPGPQYDFTLLKGHVLLSDLLTLMRGLLKNPKESELNQYLSVLPNCDEVIERKQVTLDEFLKIMALNDLPDQNTHFDILDAFETFDTDFKGDIDPETLRNVLLTMGDKELVTKEEVDEIVNTFCNRTTKAIYYDDIIKTCLSNTEQNMSTMATVISATTAKSPTLKEKKKPEPTKPIRR
ncbi:predicted protein [Naegleria gruberi]|uniref:Predicted protein n=1 Tax=Naegleria gruberi TaxID=5762 RepID=D2W2T0_NAEGR|nr:uncharacterized protein NAEGRDRAFT_59958 [Naegleria gruberi]EFC36604.1 predicted protein [Naegleria gruberi]|eukprot:XP_002669348.1 predicted protein [Naegleria gruberi strain NEG-M]